MIRQQRSQSPKRQTRGQLESRQPEGFPYGFSNLRLWDQNHKRESHHPLAIVWQSTDDATHLRSLEEIGVAGQRGPTRATAESDRTLTLTSYQAQHCGVAERAIFELRGMYLAKEVPCLSYDCSEFTLSRVDSRSPVFESRKCLHRYAAPARRDRGVRPPYRAPDRCRRESERLDR